MWVATSESSKSQTPPLWEGIGAPEIRAISEVCTFFDDIGILLHKKLIDIGMVDDLFGYAVVWMWEIVKPIIIEGYRPQTQDAKINAVV